MDCRVKPGNDRVKEPVSKWADETKFGVSSCPKNSPFSELAMSN
jgi:hypothetical protein